MDFTIRKYRRLLDSLKRKGYSFQTFEEFLNAPASRSVILRHDVDLRPDYSLRFAEIQAQQGVRGVYYFRAVPESFDEKIIASISKLGHEIGYHYENMSTCHGDATKAILDFEKNLDRLRRIVPVKTICMHGSPLSKYDSKDLWKKYNYRDYGVIGEPYFDVDFRDVFYLTDTGRRWDGGKMSVRDKVSNGFGLEFHSTEQIIHKLETTGLPGRIMFTFHPQRWTDSVVPWTREFIIQNLKNVVKRYFFVKKQKFSIGAEND